MDPRHLLVLGTPRSGTTLLASMIGRHPEVAMLIEDTGFAIEKLAGKRVAANKLCVPNQIEVRERRERGALAWLARRLPGAAKGPRSTRSIEDYLAPEASRLCVIVRNPESVVRSIERRGGLDRAAATARWTRGIEIMAEMAERLGARCLVIGYEGLVTDPERHMRRAAAFLELPYDPAMLEGWKANPIYPGVSGIDASRARADEEALAAWERARPDAWRLYRALLERAEMEQEAPRAREPSRRTGCARGDTEM